MIDLSPAGAGTPFFVAPALLAVLLFLLASWLGRWPLWVAGYAAALIALAAAFFFRGPARPDAHVQRSPAAGVVATGIHSGPAGAEVRPVAGTEAGRILTCVEEGQAVSQTQRIGPTGRFS